MELLFDILKVLFGLIVGGVIGFFVARNYMQKFFVCKKYMKKYLKDNPPINEQMIKTMMMQMGRTPSQKQINQMMKAMNKNM